MSNQQENVSPPRRGTKRAVYLVVPAAVTALVVLAVPQATVGAQTRVIPSGAAVFIEEMESDLDGFLRAEFVKQKVPLSVVLKREEAHLVLVGTSSGNEKRSWHEGWLTTTKDHATGNVTLVDRTTRRMVWAGEAGDRSLWWGSLARGGQRKVASRLVKELKKQIAAPTGKPLPPPPELSEEELASLPGAEGDRAAGSRSDGAVAVPKNESPLTNDDVLKMSSAGLSESLILEKIASSGASFRLDTDSLVALKRGGVTDAVIAAMMRRQKGS